MPWDTCAQLLYTGRWHLCKDLPRRVIVPVRTSIGLPRFLEHADKYPALRELMPYGCLEAKHDRRLFEHRYRRRLDGIGVDRVAQRFGELYAFYGRPLVLMCFEDLDRPGHWCHRRMFADWWSQRTAEPVPELSRTRLLDLAAVSAFAPAPEPGPAVRQLALL